MRRQALLITTMAFVGAAFAATPAAAHRSPATCLTNGIDLTVDKSRQVVRNGDVITYALWVENTKGNPCDITGASILVYLPTATGARSATPVSLAPNINYLVPFPFTQMASQDYTVSVNPGVDGIVMEAGVAGILHDIPQDRSFAQILKSLATEVTQPSIVLTKTATPTAGQAPQTVTYTYTVTNTSSTPVPMKDVKITDNLCTTMTGPTNDNGDGVLSNKEVWAFTCTMTHGQAGAYINTATACAMSMVEGDTTRPVCSQPVQARVDLTAPPVAVQPASATQCTLSTPNGLRVRAGEVNTIRVRTRGVDAGTQVRITLPGGRVLRDRTDRNGLAVFRVTPRRSGTARIQAAQCADVERLSVRQGRRIVSRRVPRVTG